MFIVRIKGLENGKQYCRTKKEVIEVVKKLKPDTVFSVWQDVTDEIGRKVFGEKW